ncbi:MAG TPA: hypothetical protein VIX73_25145 [Kofleriaceae bacterium]|jgi:hypothetical protein
MRSIVTIALVLSIAGKAAAQPAEPRAAPAPPEEELSESMALGLSIGPTLVAWVGLVATASIDDDNRVALSLGGLAAMAAPSFGHWYAGSPWTRGLALRTAALLPLGLALTRTSACPVTIDRDFSGCGPDRLGQGLAIAAIALYAAGTVDDIVTAPAAVRRHNERLRNLAVVPMVRRDAGGVMLAAQF